MSYKVLPCSLDRRLFVRSEVKHRHWSTTMEKVSMLDR